MADTTFDALAYFEKLKAAGMPEGQARVQANALRELSDIQNNKNHQELASKGDMADVRLEMKAMEIRLLKWQLGIALALAMIMAKGFGWLGF